MNKIIEFKKTKNHLKLKFEVPPCRRTIFKFKKPFFLSFPTICFTVKIDKFDDYEDEDYDIFVKIAFKINKRNYLIPLTNLNGDVSCLGIDTYNKKTVKIISDIFNNSDKEKLVNFVCDKFWLNRFSEDLQKNIICYYNKDKKLASLNYWERKTKENPKWIPASKDLVSLRKFYE